VWQTWTDETEELEHPTRVEVGGEGFDVVVPRDRPGQYYFTWVSGANRRYGFSSGSSDGRPMTDADIQESLRNFLAQVDPETGHIE
jgi:hypothetical protein